MDKKVKYGTEEYREAYNEGRVVNNYNEEDDTYETTLPDVVITPKNNLDLDSTVRKGTSKFIKPVYEIANEVLNFTPLASANSLGKAGSAVLDYKKTGNKNEFRKRTLEAIVDLLPYFDYKIITTPIKETDKIYKAISNNRGVHKISLETPKKGEIASIELTPSEYDDFGKKWLHPEYIKVAEGEQGKGLSSVLYDLGIKFAQRRGYNGVLSGEALLQPAKTIKTQRRFNGPEMKNPAEDYTIKGMESAKDPKMSKIIIDKYNKANEQVTSLGKELYNMIFNPKLAIQ